MYPARNPAWNNDGSINMEIELEGSWLPFTARDGTDTQEMFDAAVAGDFGEIGPAPEPPPEPVPDSVGPLQIRRALRAIGEHGAVQQWISQAGEEVQEAWEYASEIRRSDDLIAAAQQALDKTAEEVDDLFRLAATL